MPNTVFAYTVSPYRVVHRDGASFGSYLTQLCAVVGGVFTVFGLVDGALCNGIKAVKQIEEEALLVEGGKPHGDRYHGPAGRRTPRIHIPALRNDGPLSLGGALSSTSARYPMYVIP